MRIKQFIKLSKMLTKAKENAIAENKAVKVTHLAMCLQRINKIVML